MIRGRLVSDRPFLRAEVVIPAEDDARRVRTHTAFIDFHVDTGSDVTTIARADFEGSLGLSLEQSPRGASSIGVGASVLSRTMLGYLFFDDETGARSVITTTFVILETEAGEQMHNRSLLGLDVLLRGRLLLDRDNILLDLPVVRASTWWCVSKMALRLSIHSLIGTAPRSTGRANLRHYTSVVIPKYR